MYTELQASYFFFFLNTAIFSTKPHDNYLQEWNPHSQAWEKKSCFIWMYFKESGFFLFLWLHTNKWRSENL